MPKKNTPCPASSTSSKSNPVKTYSFKKPAEIARLFKCTPAQARAQLVKNRAQILGMLQKARQTGKKVNNYTESQLEQMVIGYNVALA